MYSIEETIRINNTEPGEYEKQVKKLKKLNARIEKDYLIKKNWETELQGNLEYEKKEKELKKVLRGDSKMELTKEKQLRKAVKSIIYDMLTQIELVQDSYIIEEIIKRQIELILREVSIRFYIKGE